MSVMEFGNAIKECGELILIPWCVFYFITSTCGIQFVQRTLSITGEEMRATKNAASREQFRRNSEIYEAWRAMGK